MGSNLSTFWTEETVKDLRRLWDRGDSCAEIGRIIGTSRNAVIGKASRLGLPERDRRAPALSDELLEHRRQKKNAAERTRRKRKNILSYFSGDRTPPMEIVDRPVDIDSSPIAFGGLRPFSGNAVNECRYIASEPAGPDYFACGKPTAVGESWCAACKRIVFNYQPANVIPLRRQARAA